MSKRNIRQRLTKKGLKDMGLFDSDIVELETMLNTETTEDLLKNISRQLSQIARALVCISEGKPYFEGDK